MILTGTQILREVHRGQIIINPFDEKQLNPNSYNYHLGSRFKLAPRDIIDPHKEQLWEEIEIPTAGFILEPSRVYLGHTLEQIGSPSFVTSLIGRSSVGRLGLYLQISADLGHTGPAHSWTLEMVVVQPMRIYKGMVIGQVSFWVPEGEVSHYDGTYSRTSYPLESQPSDDLSM